MTIATKVALVVSVLTILGMFGSGVWTASAVFQRVQVLEDDKSDIEQVEKDIAELGRRLDKGLEEINRRISSQWPKVGDNMRAVNRLETWRGEIGHDVRQLERRVDQLRDSQ